MRIEPIATTNYNTQFKQLKIYEPQKWDVEVMDRVVKNASIREYAAYLAEQGKDLVVSSFDKPIHGILSYIDGEWEAIISGGYSAKEDFLKEIDEFDYKRILEHHEEERLALQASQKKRDSILAEVDEFNKTIEPNQQPQNTGSKKRNFFLRLFGLNK